MAGRPGRRLKQVQQFIRDAEKLFCGVGNITVELFCDPTVESAKSRWWWDATAQPQDAVWSLERLLAELRKGAKGGEKSRVLEGDGDDAAAEDVSESVSLTASA